MLHLQGIPLEVYYLWKSSNDDSLANNIYSCWTVTNCWKNLELLWTVHKSISMTSNIPARTVMKITLSLLLGLYRRCLSQIMNRLSLDKNMKYQRPCDNMCASPKSKPLISNGNVSNGNNGKERTVRTWRINLKKLIKDVSKDVSKEE
jgi:hypothetical protein